MAKYRVVSIDGGGIRGLITMVLLQRIVATPGCVLHCQEVTPL